MTYALASALQGAVYTALVGDAPLGGMVGSGIYDAAPAGVLPPTYVVLGEETAQDRSDVSAGGAVHNFTVNVYSSAAGFAAAKDVASAICDVLVDVNLTLTRGKLVSLRFLKARARRGKSPDIRRIALIFQARVDDI